MTDHEIKEIQEALKNWGPDNYFANITRKLLKEREELLERIQEHYNEGIERGLSEKYPGY
jgi:hypothetical protein